MNQFDKNSRLTKDNRTVLVLMSIKETTERRTKSLEFSKVFIKKVKVKYFV